MTNGRLQCGIRACGELHAATANGQHSVSCVVRMREEGSNHVNNNNANANVCTLWAYSMQTLSNKLVIK